MTHRWCQVELDVPTRKFRFPTVYDTKVQIATVTVAADHVTVRFHRRATSVNENVYRAILVEGDRAAVDGDRK